MRISDWSSDVCSSDLRRHLQGALLGVLESLGGGQGDIALEPAQHDEQLTGRQALVGPGDVEVRPDGDKRISRVELGEGIVDELAVPGDAGGDVDAEEVDRKSTRLNSSH